MRTKKARRSCCRSATATSGVRSGAGAATATEKTAAKADLRAARRAQHELWWWWRRTPSVHAPAQDLPVLGRRRAEDRLQGREAPAAVRLRARQDRAEPHHGRVRDQAARARH